MEDEPGVNRKRYWPWLPAYNANGTLEYSKDAGNNQTTYSYGGNSCGAFPDTITPPISG